MQRLLKVPHFLLFILLFSACSNVEETTPKDEFAIVSASDTESQIISVDTDLEKEAGWWMVSKDVSTMTISVEAKNIETVLFWIAPTGTGTWDERTLIGYDIDESDGWSFTWEFGERVFHDHITVQAIGSDGSTQAQETISVHSSEDE
ncbi:hypothetical protein NC661_16715 [Aquibacillus koreensis]|uniref:Uncharacterized protein n=1 Tax=Aquibacillus koreensis TaxID=279446 RepID=A0A9X3WLR5_9BACI|nr:hypothetical protein [Aquibacillus koreensis]MCT2536853.1 hypothetical protein [Aquibacillus koreensis]MDC3422015.1 hypothetical protein [Aquibacillus koreensis]